MRKSLSEAPPKEQREIIVRRLWILPFFGLLFVVTYGAAESDWTIGVVGFAVGAAAFALGMFLGFLFGIPRARATPGDATAAPVSSGTERTTAYGANTNLEQISDWLTKILVGAGLVQLGQLRNSMGDFLDFLKPALGDDQTAKVFGFAVVVYFFVTGFLCGYLLTSLLLRKELEGAEREVAAGRLRRVEPTDPPPAQ
jgi:hypothetical protein